MEKQNYQICSRCLMDTSDPDIIFDAKGYCNHCTNYLDTLSKHAYKPKISKNQWEAILNNVKNKANNKKYHCVVGISGGVDSCYVAHLCKEYGLNPLLLHINNGWNTEISEQNVQKIVDHLGFDYIEYKLDWDEFRKIQIAFLKSSIVDLEMPTDIAIAAVNYKIAVKYNIPFIFSGGNFAGEGILPLQWGYHVYLDTKLYKYIVKKYGKIKIKKIPKVGLYGSFYYKFIKGIKTYYPLNYIEYNKDLIKEFLTENYGWESYGGKHHESKITAFLQSYLMPTKYNMDYRRATLSSHICAGIISREKALEMLQNPIYIESQVENDKKFIANKLEISIEKFNSYLALPPKTFKDFPNSKWLIEFAYNTYKRIKNKKN